MSGTNFQTFPDQFDNTITITWGDRQVDLRIYWRVRQGAWYFDLSDNDGVVIVLGRRLSVNTSPTSGFGFEGTELPRDIRMIVGGPRDPYARLDLGIDPLNTLNPRLWTAEEIAEAKAANAPTTFTTQIFLT